MSCIVWHKVYGYQILSAILVYTVYMYPSHLSPSQTDSGDGSLLVSLKIDRVSKSALQTYHLHAWNDIDDVNYPITLSEGNEVSLVQANFL